MNKKTFVILILVILIVLGVGYFYWNKKNTEKVLEDATKGVLPSLSTNPLENKPDINPADKANPYTNIKTNPF
jgi:predicted negative regulator of RcsB-dependent stress response